MVNIGYGGSRGGGKSRGARDVVIDRRLDHPGTKALIFRRTFNELWENQISRIFEDYPFTRNWYHVQTKTMNIPNGSTIVFGTAENVATAHGKGDIYDFQGQEYMDILVDEATKLNQLEIDFLRTCRRQVGVRDNQCKLICTMNPGGIGHNYFKRIFVDQLYVDNEIPESYAFIPANGWDNVEWVRSALAEDGLTPKDYYGWDEERQFNYFITRSQYGRDLNALPETERIQQLLGRWDYFEGQVFPELSRTHDLDTYFDTRDLVQWGDFHRELKKVGGLDHASTGVTAYGLSGIDVDENLFELAEYYERNRLISEHADGIKSLKAGYRGIDYQVIDPSTEAKTLQNKHEMFSVQDAYRREGLQFVSAHRSSIAVGIDLIKEMLKVNPLHRNPFTQELGSPRLFISRSRCPNLWREMSELQTIDGQFVGSDHAVDQLRYKVMSRPRAEARREKDVSKLPTDQQFISRTHDTWAKKFDKSSEKVSGTYW